MFKTPPTTRAGPFGETNYGPPTAHAGPTGEINYGQENKHKKPPSTSHKNTGKTFVTNKSKTQLLRKQEEIEEKAFREIQERKKKLHEIELKILEAEERRQK